MASLPINQDTKPVSKQDPVRSIEGWLQGANKSRPVVMDGKVPYGLPDARTLMNHKYDPSSKLGKHTRPVQAIEEGDEPDEALLKMSEALADYLPVRGHAHDKLLGCVDALDLLAEFDEGPEAGAAARWVTPLMTSHDMGDAIRRFANEPIDQLPVVDERDRIAGVLHRSAVLGLIHSARQSAGRQDYSGEKTSLKEDTVDGFMEPGWHELAPEAGFVETRDLLRKEGYSFVAEGGVAVDGKVGVVTPATLARQLHKTITRKTSWSPVHPGAPSRAHAPDYDPELDGSR